jgi:uncharacterized membrane protein YraQ (UPF0718 family)
VFTVKVDVAVPFAAGVTDAGAKPQVTVAFTGAMPQVNPTAELNPFNEVTVTVDVPGFPAITVAVAGDALTLKSFTVNVYAAACVIVPEVPVTVTV